MKKLMIALAVAASSVALNAASIDWSFSEQALDKNSPYSLASMTAYLFTSADWTAAMTAGVTADTFDKAKESAGLTKSTGGSGANTWSKWITDTQVWSDASAASGNYYIVLFDGSQYAASDSLAATAYSTSQESHTAATWAIKANAAPLKSSDFTAIPEPTSGLLLLLGVAGLALKRKRA